MTRFLSMTGINRDAAAPRRSTSELKQESSLRADHTGGTVHGTSLRAVLALRTKGFKLFHSRNILSILLLATCIFATPLDKITRKKTLEYLAKMRTDKYRTPVRASREDTKCPFCYGSLIWTKTPLSRQRNDFQKICQNNDIGGLPRNLSASNRKGLIDMHVGKLSDARSKEDISSIIQRLSCPGILPLFYRRTGSSSPTTNGRRL